MRKISAIAMTNKTTNNNITVIVITYRNKLNNINALIRSNEDFS